MAVTTSIQSARASGATLRSTGASQPVSTALRSNGTSHATDAVHAPQYFRAARNSSQTRQPWHGVAFLVEAIILMMFLVATMAVFTNLLMGSQALSSNTHELTAAIVATANEAESFATHPSEGGTTATRDGFTITCTTEAIPQAGGMLYVAHLVTENAAGQEVYQLTTSKYVSEVS